MAKEPCLPCLQGFSLINRSHKFRLQGPFADRKTLLCGIFDLWVGYNSFGISFIWEGKH
jgi:hypothetical protein